ncbi:MAG: hypothetical protein UR93_C0009G0035 [Berkelbacteria bacterium GW2011_GWA2_35_9]|uniref:Translation elongation factor-like protein n=1 Tax=Berkelbacteria bacterium GW2011_GWA2_35_9 TaxID=1618333 RepID=A0A0G0GAL0_9BACT|nr:MAG: hypothetical protein UR93_C0009G0035 [Berkelbacteria bacterium GW2011_GWA2_35_9]
MKDNLIGQVIHYFGNISVAVIKLDDNLSIGDSIKIEGATTNIDQTVESIQVDKKDLENADKGEEVGIKVVDKVRSGDKVYKI